MDLKPSPRSGHFKPSIGAESDVVCAERFLASARVGTAAGALFSTYITQGEFGRLARLAESLVLAYLVYSFLILVWVRLHRDRNSSCRSSLQSVDIVWTAALAVLTHGSGSSLFFLFLFVLLGAACRWGSKGALLTAAASAVFLVCVQFLVGFGLRSLGPPLPSGLDGNGFLTVTVYVLLAGGLLGFLAKKEKRLRWEASARSAQMERARIARELHDGAIQVLLATECRIDVLRRHHIGAPARMAEELGRVQQLLRGSIVALRSFAQESKPLGLGSRQLVGFLADHVEQFRRETGISVSFVSEYNKIAMPPSVGHELARIVQEALVNVRKHSGARNVLIHLGSEKGRWKLVIDDDGRGFDFSGRLSLSELDAAHKGPVVIKERVCTIGGELAVESRPGHGARLEIALPQEVYG